MRSGKCLNVRRSVEPIAKYNLPTRVEREIGAPFKQFQKLPKCTQYVTEHLETQNEYRARQVTWAIKLFLKEGRYISRNKINHFLSYRKNDISACAPLITDPEVKKIVADLLAGEQLLLQPSAALAGWYRSAACSGLPVIPAAETTIGACPCERLFTVTGTYSTGSKG